MLVLQVIFLWCLPIIYIIPWRKMQFKRMLLFFFVFFFWLFFFAPPPTPTYWFWKRRITFFISKNMTEFFPLSSNSISQMFQFAHSSMLFDLFEKKDGGEERNKEKKYIKVTYSFNKKKKKMYRIGDSFLWRIVCCHYQTVILYVASICKQNLIWQCYGKFCRDNNIKMPYPVK